ncbi:helix-turn-helix domain-containing protein [Streptomyces sp. YKOK-I1]
MSGPEPSPSPESARLAAGLRELKERTGLSLAGLAARTTFSKSSWERYLNGRTLPPRPAVRELCRLAGEPDGRYLALRDLAQNGPSATPAPAPPPPAPTPSPTGHRGATALAVLATVSALVFGAIAVSLLLLPQRSEAARPSASPSLSPSAVGPHCRDTSCEGADPVAMKCGAEPETLAEHVTATGASVQLRYGRVCGASWARMWGARIGDRVEVRGRAARVRNQAQADTYVYTLMTVTRPAAVVRACFLPSGGGAKECFEARVD